MSSSGIAVVAHGDRQVYPEPARDQVGAEPRHARRRPRPASGPACGRPNSEAHRSPSVANGRPRPFQPSAGLEQCRQLGDERGPIARMRVHRALPVPRRPRSARSGTAGAAAALGCHAASRPPTWSKCRCDSTTTSMSSSVRPRVCQRVEQHVAFFDHAVTLAQGRVEKRADAGLEQHVATVQTFASRQRQASGMRFSASGSIQRDHIASRRVAEHRAAVKSLRVAASEMSSMGCDLRRHSAPWLSRALRDSRG